MSIERLDHPAVSLVHGHGIDLPGQAAPALTEPAAQLPSIGSR